MNIERFSTCGKQHNAYPRNEPIGVRAAPAITTFLNCFDAVLEKDRLMANVMFVFISLELTINQVYFI